MLGELAPSGERTVMLGCLFVFLAACRAGDMGGYTKRKDLWFRVTDALRLRFFLPNLPKKFSVINCQLINLRNLQSECNFCSYPDRQTL